MKNYAYMRVSTETQSEKGFGLDAQRAGIERYAQEKGIEIERWFTDAGISGALGETDDFDSISKRPQLIEMLASIEAGDCVIVLNTSRLWRSDTAKIVIRHELKRRGANVIAVDNPHYDFYSKNPYDKFFDAIAEAVDELERTNIALKLAKGRAAKAAQGSKPCGVCPLGYKYTDDKKGVIIDESEAATVKRMFTLGQTGDSLQKIADAINATGARTRHGKEFSKGTIAAVLNNRFYLGELTHAGVTVTGNHPAIISRVQFGKVQKALARRKRG